MSDPITFPDPNDPSRPTLVLTCRLRDAPSTASNWRHATPADLEAAGWVRRDGLESLIEFARQLREDGDSHWRLKARVALRSCREKP